MADPLTLARENALEAKLYAYRKSKDGMIVSFVIHPDESHADIQTAPIGQRYLLAAVRLGDNEQAESGRAHHRAIETPTQDSPPPAASERTPAAPIKKPMSAAQRAGMLCNDAAFQDFLWGYNMQSPDRYWHFAEEEWKADPSSLAAAMLRWHCGELKSRSELDTNPEARKRFEILETEFKEATGRMPRRTG